MAISYVGGKVGTASGSTTTDITVALNSGLTGGSGSSVSAGDFVLVTVCLAHADDASTADLVTSGYTALTQLNADDTRDTALQVHYKFMGGTPDTDVVIARSGDIENSIAWTVQVFAGVDTTSPMDVTAVPATGIDTGLADPAAITPSTAGAWIVICAGNNHSGTDTFTWSADFEDTLTAAASDTQDAKVGSAYYTGWTSGAYNPAATTTGGNLTSGSWCAYTLALRPAGAGPATISGAATFTLAALTASGAGTVAIDGDAAITLAAATTSAAGTVAIAGSATFTLGTATTSAAGTVAVAGAASITLGDATLAGEGVNGSTPIVGESAFTLDAATVAGTGTNAIAGTASITLGAATLAGTGTNPVLGSEYVQPPHLATPQSRRRKFKIPDEAYSDAPPPWSNDTPEEPASEPPTPGVVFTPIMFGDAVAAISPPPLSMPARPAPLVVRQPVKNEPDDEEDDLISLIASLF